MAEPVVQNAGNPLEQLILDMAVTSLHGDSSEETSPSNEDSGAPSEEEPLVSYEDSDAASEEEPQEQDSGECHSLQSQLHEGPDGSVAAAAAAALADEAEGEGAQPFTFKAGGSSSHSSSSSRNAGRAAPEALGQGRAPRRQLRAARGRSYRNAQAVMQRRFHRDALGAAGAGSGAAAGVGEEMGLLSDHGAAGWDSRMAAAAGGGGGVLWM
jgi:hypothetical protein